MGSFLIISETPAKNNIIEYNEIHNIMQELNDGAGIYIMGNQEGTIIRNNIIHDVIKTKNHLYDYFLFGIYLEGDTANVLIEKNLVYRTDYGGLMFFNGFTGENAPGLDPGSNYDNVATNNIFVDGKNYQLFLDYAFNDDFTKNIVYYEIDKGSEFFKRYESNAISNSDYNLFYSPDNSKFDSDIAFWKTTYGFDANSITNQNPLFVDYDNDNFALQAGSPALVNLGFEQIDFSDVGPRGTSELPSLNFWDWFKNLFS